MSLRVKGVAGFRVNPGADHVTVQPEEGADPLLLRSYLFGSVLAILCYRRGLFPLHGSCVLLDGEAVVFSGASGAGKSTLATALALRGHPLLCDDVCAIDLGNPRRPMLRPAFPGSSYCQMRLIAFKWEKQSHIRGRHEDGRVTSAWPLFNMWKQFNSQFHWGQSTRWIRLQETKPSRSVLRGKNAFAFIESQAHRGWMGRKLGLGGQLFGHIAMLAATVPVYRLARPYALDRVDEIACLVESEHNGVCMATGFELRQGRAFCERIAHND